MVEVKVEVEVVIELVVEVVDVTEVKEVLVIFVFSIVHLKEC